MWRAEIKNHAFERFGENFHPVVDTDHFLGHSAFDVPYTSHAPTLRVNCRGDCFELEWALPGFAKEDIQVWLNKDILTIKGERSSAEYDANNPYIKEAFEFESFERSLKLAPSLANAHVSASFADSALKICFNETNPIESESAECPRRINIS